jgi:hypothetical protein
MSPFWWAYSDRLNDNVVTNQMLSLRHFTDQIPFNTLTNLKIVEAESSEGDAYAVGSDQLIFGWAVNADTDMSGKTVSLEDVPKGEYNLRLYHTWRGQFLRNEDRSVMVQNIKTKGSTLSFDVPVLKVQGGHARYIGQDIAFILEPVE